MSFVHLPPEIWLRISESLPRSDAARLCLANHQFLSLIRPLIYHHVSLYQIDRTYDPNETDPCDAIPNPIDATLSLLARDSDLAQRVSGLSLHAPSWHWEPYHNLGVKSLINLDAMRNMINLRRLELSGPIFHLGNIWIDEWEVEEVKESSVAFCEILHGIGLDELVVHHSSDRTSPKSGIGFSLEQFAGFKGLKKVGWRSHLRDWRRIKSDEGFSLSKYEDNLRRRPDAFPRLESFSGDIGSLQSMVRTGLRCLSETGSLKKLVLGPIRTDEQEQIEAVIAVGGVCTLLRESRVETFRLYFGTVGSEELAFRGDSPGMEENGSVSDPDVVRFVEGFKAHFPSRADVQAGTDLGKDPEEIFVEVRIPR
ncbi:hypothetical protein PQX77_006605 [Marasmius sp. AFHP31]|nr:hypothetical protein PQX77_006605 [Marasmius sp. AFHP31]